MSGLAAFAAAAADLLGGERAAWFNKDAAGKQALWQTYMSNTAHQRAAQDLEAAGLNRVIALGQQSTVPAGSAPTMEPSRAGSTYSQAKAIASQVALNEASARRQDSEAALANVNAAKVQAEIDHLLPVQLEEILTRSHQQTTSSAKDVADVPRIQADTQRILKEVLKVVAETSKVGAESREHEVHAQTKEAALPVVQGLSDALQLPGKVGSWLGKALGRWQGGLYQETLRGKEKFKRRNEKAREEAVRLRNSSRGGAR